MSSQITHQDLADQQEIWLLQLLRQSNAQQQMGEQLWQEIVQMLSNEQGRWQARRRALAVSWTNFRRNEDTVLGGYDSAREGLSLVMMQRVRHSKQLSQSVADLWAIASEGSAAATAERRARLADAWNVPPACYGLGIAGQYYRADDLALFLTDFELRAPGTQWGADWEQQAQRLADSNKE